MPWTKEHLKWLVKTPEVIATADGKAIEIWEFQYKPDDDVLSRWARHFRNHYCLDTEIDFYRRGPKLSRSEYLSRIKFPDQSAAPGPSIRAGDFGEILVADYLQYILGYWVPRTRYGDKDIRNESTKGCDIIGFRVSDWGRQSPADTMAVFEAKAQFSGKSPDPRLQDAVEGSAKDQLRRAESLNAMKQRLVYAQALDDAVKIERFQNIEDHPYKEVYGAVALFSSKVFCSKTLATTTVAGHPHADKLSLVVIRGAAMMQLVHDLYRRAADEA